MLSRTELCLIASLVGSCVAQTVLSNPSVKSEKLTGAKPLAYTISPSTSPVNVSFTLCAALSPSPRFFVLNGTGPANPSVDDAGQELVLNAGEALYSGITDVTLYAFPGDGTASNAQTPFQIRVGGDEVYPKPISPLLGDTTATQAIVFSPLFANASLDKPSWPHYSLPPANGSTPTPPSVPPNHVLAIYQTSDLSATLSQLNRSACGLPTVPGNLINTSIPLNTSVVLRDADGWRTQWVIEGLSPSTNYTAFVIQDSLVVSAPLRFVTKSTSFPCQLVHSLPFCPSVSYAVPLQPPPAGQTTYTASTLPSNLTDPLLSSMGNFTQSLLTFACGRDIYSPVQTCASCQTAYRSWLCSVSLPRCGESSVVNSNNPKPAALRAFDDSAPSRTSAIGPLGQNWNELLPCVEGCHAVARACPSFLGWSCPSLKVNANVSYGVGFIDSAEGKYKLGNPGMASDAYGNAWCNLL